MDSVPAANSRSALQSRAFAALAGFFYAPDNLGNPYPCQPVDLDGPVGSLGLDFRLRERAH